MKKSFFLAFLITTFAFSTAWGADASPADYSSKDDHTVQSVSTNRPYFSYGFGFPGIVELNIGQHMQKDHSGADFGIGITPVIFAYTVHLYANYLYYPSPNVNHQVYYGLGLRGGFATLTGAKIENARNHFYVLPAFVIGKRWGNPVKGESFLQASLSPGAYLTATGKFHFYPVLSLTKGFDF